jgi:hypothetical protein
MAATIQTQVVQVFEIVKEDEIATPINIVFDDDPRADGPPNRYRRSRCR